MIRGLLSWRFSLALALGFGLLAVLNLERSFSSTMYGVFALVWALAALRDYRRQRGPRG